MLNPNKRYEEDYWHLCCVAQQQILLPGLVHMAR